MGTIPYLSARCPKCGDHTSMPPACQPVLAARGVEVELGHSGDIYAVLHLCTNLKCTGATVGYYLLSGGDYRHKYFWPQFSAHEVSEDVPERPRVILQDANDAKNSPVACVTTAVRAVEAMMAELEYDNRSMGLKKRIDSAVKAGDLPHAMGDWANEVREIGNVTHTDEAPEPLPTEDDAKQALLFANMLAEYLFVLPARIPKAREPNETE